MTAVNVRQELEMVARLQHVDSQLRDLELEKGDLPNLVDRLNDEIGKREGEAKQLTTRLAEIGKEKRSNDGQIQLLRMKLEKYKEQLYSVTTNREYDAITSEIDTVRGQVELLEASQKALIEEENLLTIQISDLDERTDEVRSELQERKGELGSKQEETEDEELRLQHEREKLAVRIKKPILAHYERIRRAREGIGAAHLYAGACGACYAVVPPQRQSEIRKMNDIILCESCGVLLLPEPEHLDLESELKAGVSGGL